jgi:hypothetical protein
LSPTGQNPTLSYFLSTSTYIWLSSVVISIQPFWSVRRRLDPSAYSAGGYII